MTTADLHTLTVWHGDDLAGGEVRTLMTVRRTLTGMLHHGFISDFETHATSTETTWSYHRGTEDPGGIMRGLMDLLETLEPGWPYRARVWIAAGDD